MIKQINGLNVNYITYGKKDALELVFLHGWGQNIEMMRPLGDNLEKKDRKSVV